MRNQIPWPLFVFVIILCLLALLFLTVTRADAQCMPNL